MFFLCSTQYCGLVQYEIEILISLFVTGYRYIFPISGGVLYILYIYPKYVNFYRLLHIVVIRIKCVQI